MRAGMMAAVLWTLPMAATAQDVPKDIAAHFRKTRGEVLDIQVFRGDYSGDGKADALVFVSYPQPGGNAVGLEVSLFVARGGRLVHDGPVPDLFGTDPRDVVIVPGRIEVTTTVLLPDEPRCCPTGTQRFRITP